MDGLKELFKVQITEGILKSTGNQVCIIKVKDCVHNTTDQSLLLNLDQMNCDKDTVIQTEVNSLIQKLKNYES